MGVPIVVSIIGQKGGVGKSTLARAVAVVAATGQLRVKLVDLDLGQQTSVRWANARRTNQHSIPIEAKAYESVDAALEEATDADLIVVDTPGFLTPDTIEVARQSDIVILPTGTSSDDLHPTTAVLYELQQQGVPKDRLCVALCRLLDFQEEESARNYLTRIGHPALDGSIPEHTGYRRAHNLGRSLTETNEARLNDRAYVLMASVLKKILSHYVAPQAKEPPLAGDMSNTSPTVVTKS